MWFEILKFELIRLRTNLRQGSLLNRTDKKTSRKEGIELINGILLPKLFRPIVRKNCSSDREKLLKFEAEGQEFLRSLYRTIYSNSERSEQFLVTDCFFNLFLEVSHV